MTRFVAALLIASGGTVRAEVDERTPAAERFTRTRPGALFGPAVIRTRREHAEGVEAVRRAGREAWQVHQQRGGAQ